MMTNPCAKRRRIEYLPVVEEKDLNSQINQGPQQQSQDRNRIDTGVPFHSEALGAATLDAIDNNNSSNDNIDTTGQDKDINEDNNEDQEKEKEKEKEKEEAVEKKTQKLEVTELLMQALLRMKTKFANGLLVTEQDLKSLTLSQFDQMVVCFSAEKDDGISNNNNNNNNDNIHEFNEQELKMWKNLKKVARNRKAAEKSRCIEREKEEALRKELNATNLRLFKTLGDLSCMLSQQEYYCSNDNIETDLLFCDLEKIVKDNTQVNDN